MAAGFIGPNSSGIPSSRRRFNLGGASPITQTPLTHLTPANQALIQRWQAWAEEPGQNDLGRGEALRRVINCYEEGKTILNLSRLKISGQLPALPAHLISVKLESTDITGLADFPEGCQLEVLKIIDCRYVTELPTFPPQLQKLYASGCDLSSLPPFTQDCKLKELTLSRNKRLTSVQELPSSLKLLWMDNCALAELQNFPDDSQLTSLEVEGNPIKVLPTLPRQLVILNASHCRLIAVPVLPGSIRHADFFDNQISDLPEGGVPSDIEFLDLSNNPITALPKWLFGLNRKAKVELSSERIPLQASNFIKDQAEAARFEGRGPRIRLDLAVAKQTSRSLSLSAQAWADEEANASALHATWAAFANEEGAQTFSNFLDRLRITVSHIDPGTRQPFRQGVQRFLADVAGSPELRQDCFLTCVGATESCEDAVTVTYQNMATPRLAEEVRRGSFDANAALPNFISQARSLYRREVLTDIAMRQAKRLDLSDEAIEVVLTFQLELNEELGLNLDARQMRYPNFVRLTDADEVFSAAEQEVVQAENNGFANHLINHNRPWQLLMQRRAPELYEQMIDVKIQALDGLQEALNADLAPRGLQNDADAIREVGRSISDDLTLRAQRPFVERFLRENGQGNPNALILLPENAPHR